MKSHAESKRTYTPKEKVPVSGIYLVKHYRHRLPHEATLLEGEHFPQCHFCWEKVRFRMVHAATGVERDADFAQLPEVVPAEWDHN